MLAEIVSSFGFLRNDCSLVAFGSGLINTTWLLRHKEKRYILQRINNHVFNNPEAIAQNIDNIAAYLDANAPQYYFVQPVKNTDGNSILHHNIQGYFRLSPFVGGSHTVDVVHNTGEAFEAAAQFGKFTKVLKNFDAGSLHITLADFHNLELRYHQFTEALETASPERKQKAMEAIHFLKTQANIVDEYKRITINPHFKIRVTHHDTKISNVLFDESGKGICVIDLDTAMPGYFISDVGDMMRTYLSPVSEEERDMSKVEVRDDYFRAIAQGYLSEMNDELSETEKKYFVYAGKFMIYMQALRFLTDYLNDDVYYGQKYEGHNLIRAGNQAALLQKLIEKEGLLQQITAGLAPPVNATV